MPGAWEELERRAPDAVTVSGRELRRGARVVLRPHPGADVFDLVLAGRTAVIESIEQDTDAVVTVAVVVEDDPGSDLGFARQPGHRFFFSPEELEAVLEPPPADPAATRILVAGIGNVFLADDGFGVELVQRLTRRALPPGVDAADFGVRGLDLAFTIQEGYDAVVLLDATPRGERPGTLYAIEVQGDDGLEVAPIPNGHGMDPVTVLSLVRSFGGTPPPTYVVGCEPQTRMSAEDEEIVAGLSEPVRAALEPAVELVDSLLADIREQITNRRSRR